MELFGDIVRIPDFWQSSAVSYLRQGCDVIIDAPTGAGKTYVFEMYIEKGFSGKAVYTVPTRALANDKYSQWKSRGWRVGICTGDYNIDTDAPVVVATLETQKNRLFSGDCPDLLVIDEYQLISDPIRGFNYELAVALAPKSTQLLLMSGSVANTGDVRGWLERIGRSCRLVSHSERAVPLEEVLSTSITADTRGIAGAWPKLVKKIIDAGMSPVLIFAPHRAEAESIARKLSEELPCPDFLNLPKELASSAGRQLANMMRRRIAYHHSGLSAFQRAAVVEKYAREGKLNAVVATTGLGAGVNFSMRSVVVASREYETVSGPNILRPDELLQMYGRAGRRGKDTLGFAVCLPDKPRLSEAKQGILKRFDAVDSAASIRIMARAVDESRDHIGALADFYGRLFTDEKIDIGFDDVKSLICRASTSISASKKFFKAEILNSKLEWERRRTFGDFPAREVSFMVEGRWQKITESPAGVSALKMGRPQRLFNGTYGVSLDIAYFKNGSMFLTGKARRIVEKTRRLNPRAAAKLSARPLSMKALKANFARIISSAWAGARVENFQVGINGVSARVDISDIKIKAVIDSYGAKLFNPQKRDVDASSENDFLRLSGLSKSQFHGESIAQQWFRLGLVDEHFKPTLRGRIFSFFNGGEGYAVAAAVEDASYDISDIVFDLANLRAGGRFHLSQSRAGCSSRMADCCALAFFSSNIKGALKAGVPITYGGGASEIVRGMRRGDPPSKFQCDMIARGDIERAYLEWKSILNHISNLPDLPCARWEELKAACAKYR